MLTGWYRIARGDPAHIWVAYGDMVEPLCGTDLPEWPYMLDYVRSTFEPFGCCERCHAIDEPVDPRQMRFPFREPRLSDALHGCGSAGWSGPETAASPPTQRVSA